MPRDFDARIAQLLQHPKSLFQLLGVNLGILLHDFFDA
jgi:hypothetical protein